MNRMEIKQHGWIIKTITLMAIIWTAAQCTANSSDAYSIFIQANQSYSASNYSRAILYYKKAESLGFTPGGLYYNLGNAYYRDGKLGYAIASYLKAKQLIPRDSDVIENLNTARLQTANRIMPKELPPALRQFLFLYYKFSADELMWSSAVLIAIFFIALSVYAFLPAWTFKKFISLILIITVIIVTAAGTKLYKESLHNIAVVVTDTALVRSGPGDSYAEMFVLHNGDEVKITERKGTSVKIRIDKKKGWIKAVDVLTI